MISLTWEYDIFGSHHLSWSCSFLMSGLPFVNNAPACTIYRNELIISLSLSLFVFGVGIIVISHAIIGIQSIKFKNIGCLYRLTLSVNIICFLFSVLFNSISKYYCYQYITDDDDSRLFPLTLLYLSLIMFTIQYSSVEFNLLRQLYHTFRGSQWKLSILKVMLWNFYYIIAFLFTLCGITLYYLMYISPNKRIHGLNDSNMGVIISLLGSIMIGFGHIKLAYTFVTKLFKLIISTRGLHNYMHRNKLNNNKHKSVHISTQYGSTTLDEERIETAYHGPETITTYEPLKDECIKSQKSTTFKHSIKTINSSYNDMTCTETYTTNTISNNNISQNNILFTWSKLIIINIIYCVYMSIPIIIILIMIGFLHFDKNIEAGDAKEVIICDALLFISLGNLIFIYLQYSFSDIICKLKCCIHLNERIIDSRLMTSL